ncbi:hypothetical protein AURDEDRAFT_113702 [Auricularia subglabra TFB-10046 SS5]|nr:hypothetical protein AURDEDRAFT_113702 [Auricularia subglabra TFB-10046 SS5]
MSRPTRALIAFRPDAQRTGTEASQYLASQRTEKEDEPDRQYPERARDASHVDAYDPRFIRGDDRSLQVRGPGNRDGLGFERYLPGHTRRSHSPPSLRRSNVTDDPTASSRRRRSPPAPAVADGAIIQRTAGYLPPLPLPAPAQAPVSAPTRQSPGLIAVEAAAEILESMKTKIRTSAPRNTGTQIQSSKSSRGDSPTDFGTRSSSPDGPPPAARATSSRGAPPAPAAHAGNRNPPPPPMHYPGPPPVGYRPPPMLHAPPPAAYYRPPPMPHAPPPVGYYGPPGTQYAYPPPMAHGYPQYGMPPPYLGAPAAMYGAPPGAMHAAPPAAVRAGRPPPIAALPAPNPVGPPAPAAADPGPKYYDYMPTYPAWKEQLPPPPRGRRFIWRYKCYGFGDCAEVFKTLYNYEAHMQSHTEKPFICELCETRPKFSLVKTRRQHVKNRHKGHEYLDYV